MELLSVREHHARTLLIHYRWNVDKLSDVFVDKGKSRMFSEAGVSVVELVDLNPPEPSSTVMCNICWDDVPAKDITKMDCGHCSCSNCWTGHFIVKVNEGQSKRIRCMAIKCNAICDEAIVRDLLRVKHPDLAENFDWCLLQSYVEHKKMVKWCPSIPHCGNAIHVKNNELCEVECSCGFQFCFSCSSEAHSPCSCSMWKLWKKSDSDKWIAIHTKSCPKCDKPIEKDGGCNLISCICGQAFCWSCGGPRGRDHTCVRYKEDSYKEDSEKAANPAKRNLFRYKHYRVHYMAHTHSLEQESSLTETIKGKVSKLREKPWSLEFEDFSWAMNGLYGLLRSRRFLSYSYPFAFYMFGDDFFKDETKKREQEKKFEQLQQQLESNVKMLSSQFLEYWHSLQQVRQIKKEVIYLSNITDLLCKIMYKYIKYDLLAHTSHKIAPYQSEGNAKAKELKWRTQPNNNKQRV